MAQDFFFFGSTHVVEKGWLRRKIVDKKKIQDPFWKTTGMGAKRLKKQRVFPRIFVVVGVGVVHRGENRRNIRTQCMEGKIHPPLHTQTHTSNNVCARAPTRMKRNSKYVSNTNSQPNTRVWVVSRQIVVLFAIVVAIHDDEEEKDDEDDDEDDNIVK